MGCCLSAKIKANETLESPLNDGTVTGTEVSRIPISLRTEGEILQSSNLKSFSYQDLRTCTRNFRPDSLLGEGGFGGVFKGWINEQTFAAAKPGTGLVIAVKRLNQEGLQGHQEWLAEINYLSQLHHPNLVRLIGYCLEEEQRLLVYEFMPRGSLENHLFRRSSYFQPLSWSLRMKVALGAAKGLAFLHSQKIKVIYRDFKTSNILIDADYTAKLSDFGLARDGPTGGKSYVLTRVLGTHGYAAPEYLVTGRLTTRSDVYSFGVVLLEIMAGKRVIDQNRTPKEQNLVKWAFPQLKSKRKFFRIMDTRIQGQYPHDGAARLANLTFRCLSAEPKLRPPMTAVVDELVELQVEASDDRRRQHHHHHSHPLGGAISRSRRALNVNLARPPPPQPIAVTVCA